MDLTRETVKKVPDVTVYFWIVKILTTAMGEAASDYIVHKIDPVIAVIFGGIAFVIALALQFRVPRYVAWTYWLAVVMVAVFGTMCADVLHVHFGVAYGVSAAMFAIALGVIFLAWYRVERTLSVHSITTPRREFFYWATVTTTFALGTAVGDLTAYTFHLGFFSAGLLFTGVIVVPLIGWRFRRLGEVAAFWFAYIITRPLGASYADWMGTPHDLGGLNFGRGTVTVGLTVVIVAFVAFLSVTRVDVGEEARAVADD